tara:strand:+ start:20881 stop:22056 length:1176 start_codon:yes stop_codon:yes gene_type:complete
MNRKEWIKSGGALLAGGISMATLGFAPKERNIEEIKRNLKSSRKFVSDQDFLKTLPIDEPKIIRLMANENPFGPSPKAKEAFIKALEKGYQYSFREGEAFVDRIAYQENVKVENVLMTAGSSDVLTACGIYYTKMGGNIISGDPSYSDMPSFAEELGAEVRWVPLTSEYKLDLKAMEAKIDENTKLVYLVNPNNPTATILETEELKSFCKRVSKKATVFIDEAYIEYLDDPDTASMISLVGEGYDVIVARTFSKLYGFAGLRMGYAIASKENIEILYNNCRGFMGITGPTIAAADAAYLDMEFLNSAKTKTFESKEYLYKVLEAEGYSYIPSSANFVMFPLNMKGPRFSQEMGKRGVAVRNWQFNDKQWCRVSIGTMPQMEAFAKAFQQIS